MKKSVVATSLIAIGALGVAAYQSLRHYQHYTIPQRLLAQMKAQALVSGPITGAWIEMDPKPFGDGETFAYYGGITRATDDGLVQTEYAYDAEGQLLSAKTIA